MLILKKEKILFYISTIFLSILFYSFVNNKNYTSEVSSIPVSNHTIVIDAGHGLPDGGATDKDNNLESDLNLKIALKLQKILEASNCTVLLTRSDENGIYEENAKTIKEKKKSDMNNRVNIANNFDSEIFVSIHMNKTNDNSSGWQTFYKRNCNDSRKLASLIQSNLNYSISSNNKREIKSISDIYLAKNVNIPFVLVECGFLSNSNEASLLQNNEYQEKIVWGIYTGIMDYFSE